MNREPFNIDEDGTFYDVPPTPPHTLTDEQAGYDAPSEAALAFAEKVQRACLLDVNLYDLLQHEVARLLDAFAAQQVAAREAEIKRKLLDAPSKLDDEGATYIRLKDIGEIINGE